jgi:hypothetical protein
VAPPIWQLPEAGQSELLVQVWLVLLQCPLTIAQSLTDVQRLPRVLQVPMLGHDPVLCVPQAAPLTLQEPGCAGHVVDAFAAVQAALVMLQVPGSGVHTGGSHVVLAVQETSGSGLRLQPAGS